MYLGEVCWCGAYTDNKGRAKQHLSAGSVPGAK